MTTHLAGLRIRVPGSTSNLGPGFDLLGLALALFVEVEVEPSDTEQHVVEAPLPDGWPTNGTHENLVVRAFDAVHAAAGVPAPPQRWRVRSEVPVARGLGSSGAAVAAGLLLGNARLEAHASARPLASSALHDLGIELEGHPDNVTASLFGGCTLCLPKSSGPFDQHPTALVRARVRDTLGFAVAWTDTTLSTERARKVLPTSVPFADAVENPRRLAMLVAGLERGDATLLGIGALDRLHHRFRLALIPGGSEALAAADAAGAWLTAINGSGSSLLAIGPAERASELAEVLRAELERHDAEHGASAVGRALELVRGAPEVERLVRR